MLEYSNYPELTGLSFSAPILDVLSYVLYLNLCAVAKVSITCFMHSTRRQIVKSPFDARLLCVQYFKFQDGRRASLPLVLSAVRSFVLSEKLYPCLDLCKSHSVFLIEWYQALG